MIKLYLSKLNNQLKAILIKSIEYSDNIKNIDTIILDYSFIAFINYDHLCYIWKSLQCYKSAELTSILEAMNGWGLSSFKPDNIKLTHRDDAFAIIAFTMSRLDA